MLNSEDAEKFNLNEVKGVLITRVIAQGSAEAAGLKENDVILKFDGINVNTIGELQEQVGKHRPGDKGTVTYLQEREREHCTDCSEESGRKYKCCYSRDD